VLPERLMKRAQIVPNKFMKIFEKIKTKIKGMSLMETILAVGLVMSVIIGSLTIGIYTTRIGRGSQKRLVAMNLAREPIEVLRNQRDTNWYEEEAWNADFTACASPTWCSFTFVYDRQGTIGDVSDDNWSWLKKIESDPETCGEGCILKIDNGEGFSGDQGFGFYNNSFGEDASFYRAIQFKNSTANSVDVVSKVVWKEGGEVKGEVILEETLTDWRDD